MHAIPGNARDGRNRTATDPPLVRVNFRKYLCIEQNPMFPKVEQIFRSLCVTSIDY